MTDKHLIKEKHIHSPTCWGCCGESETSVCIFSRNRPLQLHALIQSLHSVRPLRDIIVLYKYDEKFLAALEEVKTLHPKINFIEDDNFKEQVVSFLEGAGKYSMFLVDDIVFRRPVESALYEEILDNNPQFLTFSLRMGLHLFRCYPTNTWQPLPNGSVQNNYFLWQWRSSQGDWNYPFSVDGNVFRSKQILSWVRHLNFTAPNSFEEAMCSIPATFALPEMAICNAESSLFNNPLNRVQHTHHNRSGKITAESLLEKWDEGLEIDIDKLRRHIPNGAHYVVDLSYRKRKETPLFNFTAQSPDRIHIQVNKS